MNTTSSASSERRAGARARGGRWLVQLALCAVVFSPGLAAAADLYARTNWWSLESLLAPAVPQLDSPALQQRLRNPIDAFIWAKLQEHQIIPAPEAERRTLVRRLYFDITGLPPAPEEADQFVHDPDPLAYEKLVDRLLASPRYGERWARHWLDVARYGETHGYDKDKPRPNAWPYRDYVIRALNTDKPYARFVQEQIAGDVLWPYTDDGITAMGFLAAGPWDLIGHEEVPESKTDGKIARMLDRDDMLGNTFTTFLSTTIHCARCHSHKFDPVSVEDYYRLTAVFAALDRADRRYDLDPDVAARRAQLEGQKSPLQQSRAALLKKLPKKESGAPPDPAVEAQIADLARQIEQLDRDLAKLPPARVAYTATIHHGSGAFRGTGPDGGKPRTIHVLARGDVNRPRYEVGPGTVPWIPGQPAEFDLPDAHAEGARRVALARWIVHRDNPLTWRSIVNRVWQHHFGRALANSPNDFGRMGQKPSHPELLDWLAVWFRDGDQSLKSLHRLILTSSTYRLGHVANPQAEAADADNTLYWRAHRRKLEAEAVRDAALAAAGRLHLAMGGPSFKDFVIEKPEHSPHYQYHLHDPASPAGHRRSVYRFIVRSQPQPFMAALDCADPSLSVDRRNETLSPLQALAVLNDPLMVFAAHQLARRVQRAQSESTAQVRAAFKIALSRDPTPAEQRLLENHAARHGLAGACRLILNLNEFAFVD